MKTLFTILITAMLGACATPGDPLVVAPTTFNGRVAYAEGTAIALASTCHKLSLADVIEITTLVKCTSTVEQAGTMIDAARKLGGGDQSREDILAAAILLLQQMQREVKQ